MICPSCQADLDGDLIYDTFLAIKDGDEEAALKAAELYGATKTTGRWGRQIGRSCMERDRVVEWLCPDCGHRWARK